MNKSREMYRNVEIDFMQGGILQSPEFENINSTLELEAKEIERLQLNMSMGARVLKEKEKKLKRMEQSLLADAVNALLIIIAINYHHR